MNHSPYVRACFFLCLADLHRHCSPAQSVCFTFVIALWLRVRAPPWMTDVFWEENDVNCCWTKGTQWRLVWFRTLLMWFCMCDMPGVVKSFLNVYGFMYVCNLYAWDLFGVVVCFMRKTTLTLLIPKPQWIGRKPSERSLVCTLYDSLCLLIFLPCMLSAIFPFFLSLSLPPSVSCTVFLSRSELLHKL